MGEFTFEEAIRIEATLEGGLLGGLSRVGGQWTGREPVLLLFAQ